MLLLVKFGITKINDHARHLAIEQVFSAHRENVTALAPQGREELDTVRRFSLSQSAVFYRVYMAEWWQKFFTFIEYGKFRLFRAFLSVDPNDPSLLKLVDQTLLSLQFGPMHPPLTEVSFVRARILELELTNWDVYTAFRSKACLKTETGIAIRPQPRWLKPFNVFSQNFLFVFTYAPCLSTFVGLLFSVGEPMNKFTSIALSVFIVTAIFSVLCFRFGSAWETGERILTQIYGNKKLSP